jgi:hypothetical protein
MDAAERVANCVLSSIAHAQAALFRFRPGILRMRR